MSTEVFSGPRVTSFVPSTPPPNSPSDKVTTQSAPPHRDILIDVVRGLAIMLVVLGHTNQGMLHRGWWGTSTIGVRLNEAIYAFHMPAFFFVSGVFLRAGVEKRTPKRYTIEKLRTMIYPYILWTCIFAIATIPFARYMVQTTPSFKTFFYNLATGNFSWFLPTLFVALMIGMLTRNVPMTLLFPLSILVSLTLPHTDIVLEDRAFRELPFLIAGMWLGSFVIRMQAVSIAAAAISALLCAVIIIVVTSQPFGASKYLFVPLGLLGTLMLMLLARCLGRSRPSRAIAWVGAASFGIFLLSSFPQGAGREIVLRLLHTTSPWLQLLIPTSLAVAIPAWLYHHRIRLHIAWLFVWPFASH